MRLEKLLYLSLVFSAVVYGKLRLPVLVSDNMVLQQQTEAPVWGWADAGDVIEIQLGWTSEPVRTKAGPDGRWVAAVRTPSAGGPYDMLISNGKEQIRLNGILIGEVWLCSGQSNMQWSVKGSANGIQETANADYPRIRLFTVDRNPSETPLEDTKGQWEPCRPETAGNFSGVGYFFGRTLHQQLGVPIGLINSSWGGTPIQSWIRQDVLLNDDDFRYYIDLDRKAEAEKDHYQQQYDAQMKRWQQDVEAARAAGRKPPRQPSMPGQLRPQNRCCVLYNGMVRPLIPFAVRGVIWYQGESNTGDAYLYRKAFPAMIRDWRSEWGQGNFSFYFVQLANFYANRVDDRPNELPPVDFAKGSAWAELREAQLMTLSLPHTGMAVTMDIGDPYNIHPTNKQEVGRRLALWAMAKDYGFKNIVYSGPIYKRFEKEGNRIRLYFDHTGSGLTTGGDRLKGFAVAGEDRHFVEAEARIEGDTVVVWSDEVVRPAAARYGWANWIECNLFNKDGLPASPFRTDDWPGITQKH